MTNCIIVHGCSGSKESTLDFSEGTEVQHWIPWTRQKLRENSINTQTPLMPEPWAPVYEKFRQEFKKYKVDENTVLVGHSCGCAFLTRWLGQSKQKIKKLILVAPWKVNTRNESFRDEFYAFNIDETIKSRVGEIVMFTSDNEREGGLESLKIYHQALGGRIITLPSHGHYIFEDMGTQEFSELLQEIINTEV